MSWLAYALATIVLWTLWAFLGKHALRTSSPAQDTVLFGRFTLLLWASRLPRGLLQRSGSPPLARCAARSGS